MLVPMYMGTNMAAGNRKKHLDVEIVCVST